MVHGSWRSPNPFQEICEIKIIFIAVIKRVFLPSLLCWHLHWLYKINVVWNCWHLSTNQGLDTKTVIVITFFTSVYLQLKNVLLLLLSFSPFYSLCDTVGGMVTHFCCISERMVVSKKSTCVVAWAELVFFFFLLENNWQTFSIFI